MRRTSPRTTQHLRAFALVTILAMFAVACGPRFDRELLIEQGTITVADPGAQPAGGEGATDPGATDPGATDPGATDPGTAGDPGAAGGDTSTSDSGATGSTGGDTGSAGGGDSGSTGGGDSGSTGGGDSGSTGGGDSGSPPPANQPPPASTDPGPKPGVTDTEILVGVLVPLSGAAPVPPTWEPGINLYWEEIAKDGGIYGRNVRMSVKDTESNTTTAVNQARALIQEGVFTIFTFDRLEVQAAVAKELEARGMPNVHMMLPVNPPAAWTNSFAITIDHGVQGAMIARYMKNELGVTKVGYVRENAAELAPGVAAFEAEAAKLGMEVVAKEQISAGQSDFDGVATKLSQSGAESVWLYMAPIPANQIQGQSASKLYNPIWFANSVSWAFELALTRFGDGAHAFSPWVGLDDPRANAMKNAWRARYGSEPDDIPLVGWGVDSVLHQAFLGAGENLGWNTFRQSMRQLNTEGMDLVWAPLAFDKTSSQTGTDKVMALIGDGTAKKWNSRPRNFTRY